MKAIFLDFYGTVVHEDDDYIRFICNRIANSAAVPATASEVGQYWWNLFSSSFKESYGARFQTQRQLEMESLRDTLRYYRSAEDPDALSGMLYEHWMKPGIFDDSAMFLRENQVPVYVLSNIDRSDLLSAIRHNGLEFEHIITSEDVRSYKPRPEMFERALKQSGLKPWEVLHVGDSLTSDVYGAQSLGIPVAWINRKGKQLPAQYRPDYVIRRLTELLSI